MRNSDACMSETRTLYPHVCKCEWSEEKVGVREKEKRKHVSSHRYNKCSVLAFAMNALRENTKVLEQSLRFVISVLASVCAYDCKCVCECANVHVLFLVHFLGNRNSSFTTQLPLTIHGIAHTSYFASCMLWVGSHRAATAAAARWKGRINIDVCCEIKVECVVVAFLPFRYGNFAFF